MNRRTGKKSVFTAAAVMAAGIVILGGCGNTETAETEPAETESVETADGLDWIDVEEEREAVKEKAEEEEMDAIQSDSGEWKGLYFDYLEESFDYGGAGLDKELDLKYALIYVDDDDVPELLVNTGSPMGGFMILTIAGDQVKETMFLREGGFYKERGGLFHNSDGSGGMAFDRMYQLEDGEFQEILNGEWSYMEEGNEKYYLEGEEVTMEEYNAALDEYYAEGSWIPIDGLSYLTYSELCETIGN